MDTLKAKNSLFKAGKGILNILPLLVGVVLLTSFLSVAIPKSFYVAVLGKNWIWDALVGDVIGSIAAGNPVTSYVLGGELLKKGVSLIAVAAFLVAWGTVGIVQLPVEAKALGKKFALLRSLLSFVLVLVVALVTVGLLNLIV